MKKSLDNWLVGENQKFESRVERERTLLMAQLLVLGMIVMTMYSVLDMIAGLHQTFRFSIPFLVVLILCFWLIRTRKQALAKIIFLLSANLVLFAYASTATYATGTSFYFIVASIAAFILFGYEQRSLAVLFPLLSLGLFLISCFTDIRPFAFVELSGNLVLRSFVINFLATLIASTFEVLFLMRVNHFSENDIKERELKILEQNQELLKTNSDLDRFVYSASHDLRAPLSSVMGLVHLSRLTSDESELRKYLEMIGARVKDLDRVTKDILNYSRNARTEVTYELVDAEDIIQQVWDELRFDLNASSIKLAMSLPKRIVIMTDKDRLKIILSNLFSNAIKYCNTALEQSMVVANGDLIDNFFLLEISDNGIGIGTQHQSKIFNMFYRATEKSNGSGLGLFIVKETIEKLKGEIAMTSELGQGTTFKIKIPVGQG